MTKPNIYLFPQLDDNYGYLIKNPHATEGVLVDPSDLEMCLKILELNDCKATHILLTHHHDDHIAAVHDLKNKFQSIAVCKIPNKGLGKTINDRLLRASKF